MFKIDFYNFNKKENSTKRPTTATVSYNCILKEPSSIINPTISLDYGLTNNPSTLNYCYIEAFNRYYYINEWTFDNALWTASLSVDVLATAKDHIGAKDLYILRSSTQSDTYIVDAKYPITTKANSYIDEITGSVWTYNKAGLSNILPSYFNATLSNGFYYLGINGANGTGVTWYVMSATGFNTLINNLYNFTPSDFGDIPTGMAKNIADPLQYVVKCYWLPNSVLGVQYESATIRFGTYSIAIPECAKFDPVENIQRYEAEFNIRKHPQAGSRGKYLNNAPYTNYQLFIQPFGNISLDSSLMIDDATIKLVWYVDFTTGEADLTVRATNSLLANLKATLGIPIQLSQTSVSLLGQATGVVSNLLGGTAGTILGSLAESVFDSAGIAGAKSQPKPSSMGGGGNFLPFNTYKPTLNSDFYRIVDEYNEELGRPYCKINKPSVLTGYMQALEGSLEAPYTKNELEQINSYLNGGFFYE